MIKIRHIILIASVLALLLPATAFSLRPGDLDPTFNTPKGYALKNVYYEKGGSGSDTVVQPDGKVIVVGSGMGGAFILRYDSNGTLDGSFGVHGIVTYSHSFETRANAVALQPDGKIVVAGTSGSIQNNHWLILIRLNSNGSMDKDFGDNGVVALACNSFDYLSALAVQLDGSIVVSGNSNSSPSSYPSYDVLLMRFSKNGTLDKTFGNDGLVRWGNGYYELANAMAIQPDGKIVVAGIYYNYTAYSEVLLMRFESNGILDKTFGKDGVVLWNNGYHESADAIVLQPDGKILVAGTLYDNSSDLLLLRFDKNGLPDKSFGLNGSVTYSRIYTYGEFDDHAYGITMQSDGKIVVLGSGWSFIMQSAELFLIRYDQRGILDKSFGKNGIAGYRGSDFDYGKAVSIQKDNKIVVVGESHALQSCDNILILRYNREGQLDKSFSDDGIVIYTPRGGSSDVGQELAIQPDGKIVILGDSFKVNPPIFDSNIVIQRRNSDGSLDKTFGINGTVIYDSGFDDYGTAVALQSDGKIIVVGSRTETIMVLRYNDKGSLDTSFGDNGIATFKVQQWNGPSAVSIQPDGKIVVVGWADFVHGQGSDMLMLRYNSDGTLDRNFGENGTVSYNNSEFDYVSAVAIQSDGKIVITGGNGANIMTLRYGKDGKIDKTFGVNGVFQYGIGFLSGSNALTIQPDGMIVITGSIFTWPFSDIFTLRITRSGMLDTNYGNDGITFFDGGEHDIANAIALQHDGKIVVSGSTMVGEQSAVLVLRYNKNGTLDPEFGEGGVATFKGDFVAYGNDMALQKDGGIVVAGTGWSSRSGSYDALVMRVIGELPPSPPTELSVSAVPLVGATLTWKDNSDNETGFKIERKAGSCEANTEWKQIGSTAADKTSYTDTNVMVAFQHSYRVRAYNRAGSSTYSNCVSLPVIQ